MKRNAKRLLCIFMALLVIISVSLSAFAADTGSEEAQFFSLIDAQTAGIASEVQTGTQTGNWSAAKQGLLNYYKQKFSATDWIVYNTPNDHSDRVAVYDTLCFTENLISQQTVTSTKQTISFSLTAGHVYGNYLLSTFVHSESSGICIDSKESGSSPSLTVRFSDGTQTVLTASQDAYIRASGFGSGSANASNAYGTADPTHLWVMHRSDTANLMPYSDDEMRTYISFDLSALNGKNVQSAVLTLQAQVKSLNGGSADQSTLPLMLMNPYCKVWNEASITWEGLAADNQFGHYSWDGLGGIIYNESLYGLCFSNLHVPNEFVNSTSRFTDISSLCQQGNYSVAKRNLLRFASQTYDVIKSGTGYPAARPLEPANRSLEFPYIYKTLLENDALTAEENYQLMRWYYQDIRYIYNESSKKIYTSGSTPNTSTNLYVSNWGAWHICAFYNCVAFFNEFSESGNWQSMFEARLALTSGKLINPDGSYMEVTFGYPVSVVKWYTNMLNYMVRANYNTPTSRIFRQKMIDLVGYLMNCSYPNGVLPNYGDGGGGSISNVFKQLFSVSGIEEDTSASMQNLLWYTSGGEKGVKPNDSVLYPNAKIAIDKTGWSSGDQMLFMNAKGGGQHAHHDALAMLMFAYGRNLLYDPGTITYDSAAPAFQMRTRSNAHNTVEVDGKGQRAKGSSVTDGYDGAADNLQMASNRSASSIRAYTTANADAVHYRNVTYLKSFGGLMLVSDSLKPNNSAVHTYTQNWHSATGSNPTSAASLGSFSDNVWGYTNYTSGANLIIAQARPSGGAISDISASVQSGFDSGSPTGLSDYLEFKQTSSGNVSFNTALMPYPETAKGIRTIKLSTGCDDSVASSMRIQFFDNISLSHVQDEVVYYNSFEQTPTERSVHRRTDSQGYLNCFCTDGGNAVYHVQNNEKADMLSLFGGTHLTVYKSATQNLSTQDIPLASLTTSAPVTDLTAEWDTSANKITIESSDSGVLSGTTEIEIRFEQMTAPISAVTLNNQTLVDGVNVQIGEKSVKLRSDCLFFDFTNDAAAEARYTQPAYGGGQFAFDTANWAVNQYRNGTVSFSSNEEGTMTHQVISANGYSGFENSYVQTSGDGTVGRTSDCLAYSAENADFLEMRIKFVNCLPTSRSRAMFLTAHDFGDTDFNWMYSQQIQLTFTNGEYTVLRLPLTEQIKSAGTLATLRIVLNNITPADASAPSYVTYDFIYIGPAENAPAGETHNVLYKDSDGTLLQTGTAAYGKSYGALPVPKKDGFRFDGWFTQSQGGTQVTENMTVCGKAEETLFAHWMPYTYQLTYDNMFDFNIWRTTDSCRLNRAEGALEVMSSHGEINGENGVISVTTYSSDKSTTTDLRTAYGAGNGYYAIPVKPNSAYTLTMNITTEKQGQYLVFGYDAERKIITQDTRGGEAYASSGGVLASEYFKTAKTVKNTFVTTDHTAYIQLRFGNASYYDQTSTFSNIRIMPASAPYSEITYTSAGKQYACGTFNGALMTPHRENYKFRGWFTGENGTGRQITDENYALLTADTTLYSAWDSWILSSDTLTVNYESQIIYGFQQKQKTLNSMLKLSDEHCSIRYESESQWVGTGTQILVIKNGSTAESYTAILFGDVNGDGAYDGQDSIIVNCIANGLLSREQVGESKWMAADCSHDGEINSSDVLLLEQAGLLLANVDQMLR